MSANADVKIRVTLQDRGSQNLLRQLGLIDKATGEVSTEAARAGSALNKMGGGVGAVRAGVDGLSKGVRDVSGRARDANGQFSKMRENVKGVGREIDGWGSKLKGVGSIGARAVAGWAAGKMVAGSMLNDPMAVDAKAQDIANTAAHDKDAQGKIAEKANVKSAIETALKVGGTQDMAYGLLEKMIAGGMNKDEAYKALPDMMQAAIGSKIEGGQLGDLINTLSNSGFKGDEIKTALSEMVKGGQMGSFEADQMVANGFSKLMQNNLNMGMSKNDALRQTVGDLQILKRATGSDATAATYYENLQNKIMSSDLQKSMKKQYGVDVQSELKNEAVQGNGVIAGFNNIVDRIVAKQGNAGLKDAYAGLKQAQAQGASAEEIQKRLDTVKQLDVSGVLSGILTDMQALGALKGLRTFEQVGKDVQSGMAGDAGQAIQGNYQANQSTAQASVDKNKAQDDVGKQKALDSGGSAAIKVVNDGLSGLKAEFPALNAALQASTVAVGMLTAAVMASTAAGVLTGGKGGVRDVLDSVLGGGKGKGGLGKGLGNIAKTGGKALGFAGTAIAVGSDVMTLASADAKPVDRSGAKGSLIGSGVGAVVGGIVGTLIPVAGTALGAALGSAAGSWLGDKIGRINYEAQQPPAISPQMATTPANSYRGESMANNSLTASVGQAQTAQLTQSNAQLQQVNAQIAQLQQVANNEKLLTPLGQIQSGIAALNGKPWTFSANNIIQLDGRTIAQSVNTFNGVQAARG